MAAARQLGEQAAAAESLGRRLVCLAVDRFTAYVSGADRPAELHRDLSDQADAATTATRARATRATERDQGRER